jgi:ATP-binding cassette subfamily C (CFTR/MRP) protein 1
MGVEFDGPAQRPIFESGSFTGYRPLLKLGSGYLGSSRTFKQPLCGQEEGWGPLSPIRYDFTPCFIDVWVATVAAYGLVFGLLAAWWVLRKRKTPEVEKDWNFWVKQVSSNSNGFGQADAMD